MIPLAVIIAAFVFFGFWAGLITLIVIIILESLE